MLRFIQRFDVAIIIMGGFLLRLLFLFDQSLWMDESSVYWETWLKSLAETWELRHLLQPQNAPIYTLTISFLEGVFEIDEFIYLRLFSAVLGGVSIYVIHKLSSLFFNDKKNALAFLLLVVLSTIHIQFSQVIRFYILLFLFFYCHMYFSLKYFKAESNNILVFVFLFSALGCWSNQLMALGFMFCSLYYIAHYGFNFKKLFIYNLANIAGFLTYLPSYLLYINGNFKIGSFRKFGFGDFIFALKSLLVPKHIGPSLIDLRVSFFNSLSIKQIINGQSLLSQIEMVLALLFCLGLIFIFCNFKKLSKNFWCVWATILFFCTFLYVKGVSFNDRYFLIFIPLIILLFVENWKLLGRLKVPFIYLIFLLNILSLRNYFFNSRHQYLNVDLALSQIQDKRVFISFDAAGNFLEYFRKKFNLKSLTPIERLANRSEFETFLPEYFGAQNSFVFVDTHRGLLTKKVRESWFGNMSKTHEINRVSDTGYPYFQIYRFIKR